jgi:hypothetical protein
MLCELVNIQITTGNSIQKYLEPYQNLRQLLFLSRLLNKQTCYPLEELAVISFLLAVIPFVILSQAEEASSNI